MLRNAARKEFPGSQPVSLSSENWHLIQNFRCASLCNMCWACTYKVPQCVSDCVGSGYGLPHGSVDQQSFMWAPVM